MKALYVAGFAAALFTTQAFAQAVVIAPEQRTVIRDYVVKEKIRPYRMQSRVTVGATLPAEVELAPVPGDLGADVPFLSLRLYRR